MLCQYNNIYADSSKYLKVKKVQTKDLKKKALVTVVTVSLEQTEVTL